MLVHFLQESPLAEAVTTETKIVLHRTALSLDDLEAIREEGGLSVKNGDEFELEVNGLVLAAGRIVKKRGEHFFKITRMNGGM